jgi:hypothetical protein
MTPEQQQTLHQAITRFGVPNQLDMVIEEAAELIQSINKARRAKIVHEWGVSKPCMEQNMDQIEAYNNLCAETADMKIMLAQLEMMLDEERIKISFDRKINRLQENLNKIK